jgi:endonuclease-3
MHKKTKLILKVLENYFPKRLRWDSPFKVLISCILSQRTKEENTEKASKNLFAKADSPQKILSLRISELEKLIKSAGFYKQKARRIKAVCKILLEKYGGKVPSSRKELLSLPGVGFKTSAIVLSYGFGIPIIAVDTHVNRISKRLGLVKEKASVEEVRENLQKIFPKNKWFLVNLGFVNFGREVCKPIKPKCEICELKRICEFYKKSF